MFTMQNTYNEVLQSVNPVQFRLLLGNMLFSDEPVTSLLPEPAYSLTLQEIHDTIRTPWNRPFPADEIMTAANLAAEAFDKTKWEIRGLWSTKMPTFDGSKQSVCLFTPVLPEGGKRPPVIVVPGGGYQTESMVNEGFGLAKALLARGFRPYILHYRTPSRFPNPQMELMLAILHVRANAEKDGTDPNDLMIMGFSAGGHLCASTATRAEEVKALALQELEDAALVAAYRKEKAMPDKLVLGYAVTTLERELCEGLPGICDDSERLYWSPMRHVTPGLPKTYLWACTDDTLVPYQHATRMDEALRDAGIPTRCRIFPSGGHGIALGIGTSAEGWFEDMLDFMKDNAENQ